MAEDGGGDGRQLQGVKERQVVAAGGHGGPECRSSAAMQAYQVVLQHKGRSAELPDKMRGVREGEAAGRKGRQELHEGR